MIFKNVNVNMKTMVVYGKALASVLDIILKIACSNRYDTHVSRL